MISSLDSSGKTAQKQLARRLCCSSIGSFLKAGEPFGAGCECPPGYCAIGGRRRSQYLRKEFCQRAISVSLPVVQLDFVDIELCEQFFKTTVLNAPGKSPAAHDPHV